LSLKSGTDALASNFLVPLVPLASREFIKQFDWPIGYPTSDQAEKVGMLISKKWIDAGKP
jgi:hypothetical protein